MATLRGKPRGKPRENYGKHGNILIIGHGGIATAFDSVSPIHLITSLCSVSYEYHRTDYSYSYQKIITNVFLSVKPSPKKITIWG